MRARSDRHIHRTILLVAMAALLGAFANGCGGISKEALKEARTPSSEFLIGPEDVIDVLVWRNADLSRQVVVRPDGMISLPLIGEVRASGLSADQLADRITEKLKQFKESPRVTVHVMEVNSYNLYVLGEVANPGKYQLKSYATVLQAIALAGGFTQFASKDNIAVLRRSVNGDGESREIRIPVSYSDLLAGSGDPGNFTLKSGDVVVVP